LTEEQAERNAEELVQLEAEEKAARQRREAAGAQKKTKKTKQKSKRSKNQKSKESQHRGSKKSNKQSKSTYRRYRKEKAQLNPNLLLPEVETDESKVTRYEMNEDGGIQDFTLEKEATATGWTKVPQPGKIRGARNKEVLNSAQGVL